MKQESFTCDVCGARKGEANHWYKIRSLEGFHVYRWDFFGEGASDYDDELIHCCGEKCVMKSLSDFMGKK